MPRLITTKRAAAALALLATTATPSTAQFLFRETPYPDCNACLSATENLCGTSSDDLTDQRFAQCLCDGDGAVALGDCATFCSDLDTSGAVLQMIFEYSLSYCTAWYPGLCPQAEGVIDDELFEDLCGSGSGSGSSRGDDEQDSGSGSGSYV